MRYVEEFRPQIEEERDTLLRAYPHHADRINRIVDEAFARFQEALTDAGNVIELCPRVDRLVSDILEGLEATDRPELLRSILAARQRLLSVIASSAFTGELRGDLPDIPRDGFRHGPTRPAPLSNGENDRDLDHLVDTPTFRLGRLVSQVGVDAAADVLYRLGRIGYDMDRARVIDYLRRYFGRSAPPPGGESEGWILQYPAKTFEVPSMKQLAMRNLTRHVYRRLFRAGIDQPDRHAAMVPDAPRLALEYLRELAQEAGLTDLNEHAALFLEIRKRFADASALTLPPTLLQSISQQGQQLPLPSYRQRLQFLHTGEWQHSYIGADPGLGKTFVGIWKYESIRHQRAVEAAQKREKPRRTRMLWMGPPSVLRETPNNIIPGIAPKPSTHCFYPNAADRPSVGILSSELTTPVLQEAATADIVFLPYTMLPSERSLGNEQFFRLVAFLRQQSWDVIVGDEAHWPNGAKRWTGLAEELVHESPGFYKNGSLILMSGTPAPYRISDLWPAYDLMLSRAERTRQYGNDTTDRYGKSREGRYSTVAARNEMKRVCVLDEARPWEQHVRTIDYELSREEMDFIESVCSDPTIPRADKQNICLRFIRCPRLISEDANMPSSFRSWLEMQMADDLSGGSHTLLIAEHRLAQGILRERDTGDEEEGDEVSEHYFFNQVDAIRQALAERFGMPVHFFVIHGETPIAEREAAYAQAEESQRTGESKTVILGYASCFNVGINLSFIKRMISLYWYISSQLQQLLSRSLREGNEDIWMTVFTALRTLEVGMREKSQDHHKDIVEVFYGSGGVSDSQLERHAPEDEDDTRPRSEQELEDAIGQIAPALRRYEVEQWLHGRGMHGCNDFWERHQDLWVRMRREADQTGTGDTQRFLAGLIARLSRGDNPVIDGSRILHVQSNGASMDDELRRLGRHDLCVTNVDPHAFMFEEGRGIMHRNGQQVDDVLTVTGDLETVGSRVIRETLSENPLDTVVIERLERCNVQHTNGIMHERARALWNAIQPVKENGTVIIVIPELACTTEEFTCFANDVLPLYGCEVMKNWTGTGRSVDNAGDQAFRTRCIVAKKVLPGITKEDIAPNLLAEMFRFTHHSEWPHKGLRERTMNMIRRTQLPYPLRHEEFELENKRFCAAAHPTYRAEQLAYLQRRREAVEAIRGLAATAEEWNALPAGTRSLLVAQGITHMDALSTTVRRPAFRLQDDGAFLFPYDPQWNA